MIRPAQKVAILAISEKMNSVRHMKVTDLGQIDYLLTELPADSGQLAPYRTGKTTVL